MKNVLWSEVMNLCSNLLYEKPPCLSMDCQTFKTKKETCKGLFPVYSVFISTEILNHLLEDMGIVSYKTQCGVAVVAE